MPAHINARAASGEVEGGGEGCGRSVRVMAKKQGDASLGDKQSGVVPPTRRSFHEK